VTHLTLTSEGYLEQGGN